MLAGCTRKHSSPPSLGTAKDLQGIWKVWTTEAGHVDLGPAALFLWVAQSTISGADLSGTVDGSTFEFTAPCTLGYVDVRSDA